jgi:hypothetical protein
MTTTTRDENLSYLRGRLGDLRQELREMPEHKKASQWHCDRLELCQTIERQIRRLEATTAK